nr:MAG TPA: hypothetical protein [Caudoviricetes sp.]
MKTSYYHLKLPIIDTFYYKMYTNCKFNQFRKERKSWL